MVTKQRAKELDRLKGSASSLWSDQQELLSRAGDVLREAGTQAGHLSREEYVPRLQTVYAEKLQPTVHAGAGVAASAAQGANTVVFGNAVPAVSSAAAAALALGGTAKERITDAAGTAASAATKAGASVGKKVGDVGKSGTRTKDAAVKAVKGAAAVKAATALTDPKNRGKVAKAAKGTAAAKAAQKALATKKKKSGPGIGGVVGITIGVIALVGIAYAVWQTLRADDDLWVADDEPEVTPDTPAA